MYNPYIKEYRTDGTDEILNRFFSEDNIQLLQVLIINEVKKRSNVLIGPQSKMDLINFMHKAYKTRANTFCPNGPQGEVDRLNKEVVFDCVENILFNMKSYSIFIKDMSTLPVPLDRGISTNIDKSLEMFKDQNNGIFYSGLQS